MVLCLRSSTDRTKDSGSLNRGSIPLGGTTTGFDFAKKEFLIKKCVKNRPKIKVFFVVFVAVESLTDII